MVREGDFGINIFLEIEAESENPQITDPHEKKCLGISRLKKYNIYIVYNYIYPTNP